MECPRDAWRLNGERKCCVPDIIIDPLWIVGIWQIKVTTFISLPLWTISEPFSPGNVALLLSLPKSDKPGPICYLEAPFDSPVIGRRDRWVWKEDDLPAFRPKFYQISIFFQLTNWMRVTRREKESKSGQNTLIGICVSTKVTLKFDRPPHFS